MNVKHAIKVNVKVTAKGSNKYEFYLTTLTNQKVGVSIVKTLSFVKSVKYLRHFLEHNEYIDTERRVDIEQNLRSQVLYELFSVNTWKKKTHE